MRKFYLLLLAVLPAFVIHAQHLGVKEIEPNNSSATATPILSNPAKIKGNISPDGELDYYSFTAAAGDKIYATVQTSFASNASFDADLRLFASDGTTVIEYDDLDGSFGSTTGSIAGATIPSAGTYYIQVSHFSATNRIRGYDLYFKIQSGTPTPEVESNDIPASANVMPASGWVSGARNPAAAVEQDWYSVTLAAGESVFISMDLDPERDNVQYNGRLGFALFGDASNQILVVDDGSTGSVANPLSEAFVYTAKDAGTYYVFADAASAATGGPTATYNISFSKFSAATGYVNYPSADVPKIIGPGTGSVTSTINIPDNKLIKDAGIRLNLNHLLMADIDATLTTPNGSVIHLFTDIGATATGGQTQMDLLLNDNNGVPPVFTVMKGVAIQPEVLTKLDMLKGVNTAGTWTLTLYDDGANTSGGTLNNWSIDILEEVPPNITGATVIANENFETSDGGFTHSGTQDEWARGTPTAAPITTANSGVNCWKTDLAAQYNASSNQILSSPTYAIPAGASAKWLSWAMKHQMENRTFDSLRIYVEEVGNPANSVTLFDWMGATPQTSIGSPGVTTNFSAGWGTHWADISAFSGKNIQFKVKLASDGSVQLAGVAIDDFKIFELCTPSSITLGASPIVCQGSTSTGLSYTATTGAPDQYSIDYDAAAEAAGFVDVVNASLPASPVTIVVPGTAAAATYNATITVRKAAGGCVSPAVPFTVTVNAAPALFNVTGGGTYCDATGVPVGLSGSETGVNYQLQLNTVNTGAPVAGTGGPLTFGAQTAVGTYTVIATHVVSNCINTMTGSASVATATAPVVNAPTVTQPTNASPTGTIVVNATGSGTLEYRLNAGSYQLSNTFTGLTPGNSYNIFVRLQNTSGCEVAYSGNPVVLNSISGRSTDILVGASPFQDSMWTINLANYTIIRRLGPTLTGFTITGMNGIATNPLTGEHFMIAKVSTGGRRLVKVNVQTGVCTDIGSLGAGSAGNFSTLAFKPNGELYGVTGNGGVPAETMFKIDTLTAVSTLYRTLGNGADGEVIAYNPDDNFFYHWSGNGTVVWEKFATDVDPIIPLTTPVNGEVFGALYAGNNKFYVSNIASTLRIWDANGTTTPVLMNTPDDLRGLVKETCLSTITAGGSTSICSGNTVVLTVNGGTGNYQWYQNGVLIPGANASSYPASTAGLYNAIYTDGCGVTDSVSLGINVSVLPTPDATATPSSQTICSASAISNIVLSGTVSGTTFNWTRDNTATVTGIAANGSGDISGSLTNTTNAPVTVTFTITPTASGCNGTPITATVLVNPTPDAVATPSSQTICSGNAITTIALSGSVTGTTYSWTRDNTATVTGISASGNGNISGSLTNTTTAPVTVTFTITPTANGCPGTAITATVLVNPTPDAVATPSSQTICSGNAITTIALSGAVTGTTYSWTRNNTATVTGIAASGNGNISGSLTNTTTAPVTVTFTITPTANGCPGTAITATVLVNPTPDAVATPSSQTICSGNAITTIALSGSVSGTTYSWTRNNTATVTGIAANGTGNISGSLTNTTTAPVTVTFTITPSANGCAGTPITATVLVNPTPNAVATPASQTICSGNAITTIALSGAVSGTTYSWTRNNTANVTGIAASGSGNISGSLTNTTSAPVTVTFTITPSANGCAGSPITATVLVNPTPNAVATPASQTVCSGSAITTIVLSGAVTGTTYSWTRDNAATITGIAASGNGNISGTFTNTTTSAVTVTFTITPTANGCVGTPITATVTVQAPLSIVCPANITAASVVGACTAVVNYSPTVNGTPAATLSYTFTGATTGSGAGSGSGSAFNVGVTTVNITATNSCGTVSCSFTITVTDSQLPVVSAQPANRTVCSGGSATFTVTASNVLSYQWQQWNGTAWVNIAGATASSYTVSNATTSMNTNTFRAVLTGLCSVVNSNAATLFVNPVPSVTISASPTTSLLPNQTTTLTALTNPSGGTYAWFFNGTAVPGVTGPVLGPIGVDGIGSYRVVYTDPLGCVSNSSSIVISGQASEQLWVYPNPNNGQFQVRYFNQVNEKLTLNIYNALGQKVYQKEFNTTTSYTRIDVNLGSSFSEGVYTVEVINSNGVQVGARRIIVRHP